MSRTTLLAGGVGGARLARGLAASLPDDRLTIIVNTGDDDRIYGAHVAADLDTVVYTLAGIEGPHGWGIRDDTFTVMEALGQLGVDTTFRLGDRDLAVCLARTVGLDGGRRLSELTHDLTKTLGVATTILPATDDRLRTRLLTAEAGWLDFQDYFVRRRHRDRVTEIEYAGAANASPAPDVVDAITNADRIVIAPSNPPLSIHPILSIGPIRDAVENHGRVIAVSPLIGGRALKGPADRVLESLGYPDGNLGIAAAYDGLVTDLVIDTSDAADAEGLPDELRTHVTDTRFPELEGAVRFADWLLALP